VHDIFNRNTQIRTEIGRVGIFNACHLHHTPMIF
jgi:hypothetical protein